MSFVVGSIRKTCGMGINIRKDAPDNTRIGFGFCKGDDNFGGGRRKALDDYTKSLGKQMNLVLKRMEDTERIRMRQREENRAKFATRWKEGEKKKAAEFCPNCSSGLMGRNTMAENLAAIVYSRTIIRKELEEEERRGKLGRWRNQSLDGESRRTDKLLVRTSMASTDKLSVRTATSTNLLSVRTPMPPTDQLQSRTPTSLDDMSEGDLGRTNELARTRYGRVNDLQSWTPGTSTDRLERTLTPLPRTSTDELQRTENDLCLDRVGGESCWRHHYQRLDKDLRRSRQLSVDETLEVEEVDEILGEDTIMSQRSRKGNERTGDEEMNEGINKNESGGSNKTIPFTGIAWTTPSAKPVRRKDMRSERKDEKRDPEPDAANNSFMEVRPQTWEGVSERISLGQGEKEEDLVDSWAVKKARGGEKEDHLDLSRVESARVREEEEIWSSQRVEVGEQQQRKKGGVKEIEAKKNGGRGEELDKKELAGPSEV